MIRKAGVLTAALSGIFFLVFTANAEIKGRYKIYRVSGDPVVGEVTELPNAYEVEIRPGIKMKIPKTQVREIVEAPVETKAAPDKPAAESTGLRRNVTDEQINAIIGSDNIQLSMVDAEEVEDVMGALPLDYPSLQEMLRIAQQKAKHLETDHFVCVYTSEEKLARDLVARLEKVYEWNVKYAQMFGVPIHRPDAKLEIYFFGTHEEYDRYQTLNGFREIGAIGFYSRTVNRSAFFDMETYPVYANIVAQTKDKNVAPERRQELAAKLKRRIEHENIEVVQHEAAHHIHFNIGIYPGRGDLPRWMTEGLATMFETPPSEAGASFGSINHMRLFQFRNFFGEKGERIGDLREFILNDGMFGGYAGYLKGWALNLYMIRKHRDAYAKWMQLLADRPDDEHIDTTQKLSQFEDLFGAVNDDWIKDFNKFIAELQLKRSLLPPDIE